MSIAIRQDLELFPVDPDRDGVSSFVLHDPAAGRYYRLSTQEVELLRGPLEPPTDAADRVSRVLGRPVSPEIAARLAGFLRQHDLVVAAGPDAQAALLAKAARQAGTPAQRLVRSYMFLKVPLFRPDRFLEHTLPWVAWLLTVQSAWAAALIGIIGGVLVTRQWEAFLGGFLHFFSWEGALAYGFVLFGVKGVHELAHAYTAKRHGAKVFTMGIAFIVFWPVFYTDTSDSWRLRSRDARLRIAAAGIRIELMIAAVCLFLWSFLPDGPVRSIVFLLASSTWILTLVINLNPLMKFDGYFLLADLLNTENLQERSLALWAWRRRRWLWGFDDPAPEPPRRWMLLYAIALWCYRFMLTLSIALIVYGYVFKLLGLFLLILQLTLFLGTPVARELMTAYRRRGAARLGFVLRTLTAFSLFLAMGFIPWSTPVSAPALQTPRIETLYAPADARIEASPPEPGTAVSIGQPILRMSGPDLQHGIAEANREIEVLRWQLSVLGMEARIAGRAQVLEAELRTTIDRMKGLEEQARKLTLIAPFSGVIGDQAPGLKIGAWVGAGDTLMTVVDSLDLTTRAYISEQSLHRVEVGAEGWFYPADGFRSPSPVRVVSIEPAALRELDQPVMSVQNGGMVPVRQAAEGRLIPVEATYRIELAVPQLAVDGGAVVGRVVLQGSPERPIESLWRRVTSVLRRELAF